MNFIDQNETSDISEQVRTNITWTAWTINNIEKKK